jgi:hypothetical protein
MLLWHAGFLQRAESKLQWNVARLQYLLVAQLGLLHGCNEHCTLTNGVLLLVFWVIARAKRNKSVQRHIARVLFGLSQLL